MIKLNPSKKQRVELYKQDITKLVKIKEYYGLKSLNSAAGFCIEIVNDFLINSLDPIKEKMEIIESKKK
ncbi:MAG: hypothetical protein LBV53_00095 [Mycoplasmataceae bacterium]|jgi:tetrahydromethanopterin S-methyltransferase subunit B|nr:hypothetical protein [Mycoplasmataceae bacterium]